METQQNCRVYNRINILLLIIVLFYTNKSISCETIPVQERKYSFNATITIKNGNYYLRIYDCSDLLNIRYNDFDLKVLDVKYPENDPYFAQNHFEYHIYKNSLYILDVVRDTKYSRDDGEHILIYEITSDLSLLFQRKIEILTNEVASTSSMLFNQYFYFLSTGPWYIRYISTNPWKRELIGWDVTNPLIPKQINLSSITSLYKSKYGFITKEDENTRMSIILYLVAALDGDYKKIAKIFPHFLKSVSKEKYSYNAYVYRTGPLLHNTNNCYDPISKSFAPMHSNPLLSMIYGKTSMGRDYPSNSIFLKLNGNRYYINYSEGIIKVFDISTPLNPQQGVSIAQIKLPYGITTYLTTVGDCIAINDMDGYLSLMRIKKDGSLISLWSPNDLMSVIDNGNVEEVKKLVDFMIDPRGQLDDGTPIMLEAIKTGKTENVIALLEILSQRFPNENYLSFTTEDLLSESIKYERKDLFIKIMEIFPKSISFSLITKLIDEKIFDYSSIMISTAINRIIYCKDSNVWIRSEPGVYSTILGKVNDGDKLKLIDIYTKPETVNNKKSLWLKVKTKDQIIGWTFGYYFSM